MKQKTLLTALLAMCLLLTACGKKPDAAPVPLAGAEFYSANTKSCYLPLSSPSAACVSGEAMFLAGIVYQEPEEDGTDADVAEEGAASTSGMTFSITSGEDASLLVGNNLRAALCRLDPVTGRSELLEGYAPEPGVAIMALALGADGTLWVLEQDMGSGEDIVNTAGPASTSSILTTAASTPGLAAAQRRRLSGAGPDRRHPGGGRPVRLQLSGRRGGPHLPGLRVLCDRDGRQGRNPLYLQGAGGYPPAGPSGGRRGGRADRKYRRRPHHRPH